MKQDYEQLVLRSLSGELGLFGRWRVHRLLAAHPELRAYAAALRQMQLEVQRQSFSEVPATPRDVMAAILAEADRTPHSVHTARWLAPIGVGAAALAAALLGVWVFSGSRPATTTAPVAIAKVNPAWEDTLDAELAALKADINQHSQLTISASGETSELDALAEVLAMNEESQR